MLLCPAPATTMSKRSSLDACWPMENGVTASGASAAVFTNPRLLILLMGTPPLNYPLRFLPYDFLDTGPEIFQHHCCRIPPRSTGYGSAGMCRRSRLIQTCNRHAVLRPARRGAHRSRLRRPRSACVTTPVPVVRIHPFQIQRALYDPRENFVIGQIGRELPQKFQIRVRNLILDFVPMLRALFQFVRVVGNDLESVHACGGTCRVSDAAANCVDRRILKIHCSTSKVITHAQDAISANHHSGMHGR